MWIPAELVAEKWQKPPREFCARVDMSLSCRQLQLATRAPPFCRMFGLIKDSWQTCTDSRLLRKPSGGKTHFEFRTSKPISVRLLQQQLDPQLLPATASAQSMQPIISTLFKNVLHEESLLKFQIYYISLEVTVQE